MDNGQLFPRLIPLSSIPDDVIILGYPGDPQAVAINVGVPKVRPMKFRLFYWFRGAPKDRPGGPWWAMDFLSLAAREKFFNDIEPHLFKWVRVQGDNLPVLDPMEIRPPRGELEENKNAK